MYIVYIMYMYVCNSVMYIFIILGVLSLWYGCDWLWVDLGLLMFRGCSL